MQKLSGFQIYISGTPQTPPICYLLMAAQYLPRYSLFIAYIQLYDKDLTSYEMDGWLRKNRIQNKDWQGVFCFRQLSPGLWIFGQLLLSSDLSQLLLIKLEDILCGPHTPTPLHPHRITKWQELIKCPHLSKDRQSTLQPDSCNLVFILLLLKD